MLRECFQRFLCHVERFLTITELEADERTIEKGFEHVRRNLPGTLEVAASLFDVAFAKLENSQVIE